MNMNDLDKLFRQKLSQRKVAFDEQAWSEMEELLKKRERKRRWLGWWFMIPLLMLFSAGSFIALNGGLYGPTESDKNGNQSVAKRTVEPNDKEPERPGYVFNTLFQLNEGLNKAQNQGQPDQLLSSAVNNPETRPASVKPGKPESRDAADGQNSNEKPDASAWINEAPESGIYKQQDVAATDHEPTESLENSALNQQQANLAKFPLIASQLNTVNAVPGSANTLPDSMMTSPHMPEPFEWGLAGGTQLAAGGSGQTFQNASPQPVVGGYARWHLGNDWYLNAELLYRYNPKPDYQETVTERTFNFGFEAVSSRANLEESHYVAAPLYLDYQLLEGHGIIGGLQGSWLATASGDVVEKSFASFGESNVNRHSARLKPDGLKTWQLKAMLGYRFDYNDQWRLQFRGLWGQGRIQNRAGEVGSTPDQNVAIQLMLQYQLN